MHGAHAFNPSTGKKRQVDLCEFDTSLVYIELQDSQGYIETLSQNKKPTETKL